MILRLIAKTLAVVVGLIALLVMNGLGVPFALVIDTVLMIFGLVIVVTPFYILFRKRPETVACKAIDWEGRIKELQELSLNASREEKDAVSELTRLIEKQRSHEQANVGGLFRPVRSLAPLLLLVLICGLVLFVYGVNQLIEYL